ncbi:MAG TPA: hypothetical protein VGP41_14470 [Candidatus Lustribacter sp.]|jgi:hypothetical protein|nr:hypothetical protein [Candidatus Lustribacter sp.]
MNVPTAVVPGGSGVIAHVSDGPVYTAPAAHAFAVAPAAHFLPLAPAGHVYIAPAEQSSGIGINVDHAS